MGHFLLHFIQRTLAHVTVRAWIMGALVLCVLSPEVFAETSDLARLLATPDYVLMMRHTRAPGVGDPPTFTLGDCATQRNLSEEGIAQAVRIGDWLRQQGIRDATLFASPWCRTIDTATLLRLGPVTPENSLASTFEEKNTSGLAKGELATFIAQALKNKGSKALILVTHQVNIEAYTGEDTAAGEMILVHVDAQGKMLSHTLYPRPD
ncbi:histidine phosphatase family protein [Undibacterium sp. MH2W]|uniref:histidine phosphatase family protein n=1 Tax=Undibacterium sp. MH2W TaxID=3413044 RepID=UPI003BF114A4